MLEKESLYRRAKEDGVNVYSNLFSNHEAFIYSEQHQNALDNFINTVQAMRSNNWGVWAEFRLPASIGISKHREIHNLVRKLTSISLRFPKSSTIKLVW